MKNILLKLLALVLIFVSVFSFAACKKDDNNNNGNQSIEVRMALPDGTPVLAAINFMANKQQIANSGNKNYDITTNIVPAANIAQTFSSGQAEFAVMPTVAAANLYDRGGDIRLLSTNVFGNLYVAGVNGISEDSALDALKGKIVYVSGATTVSLFEYILSENGIDYEEGSNAIAEKVTLFVKSEASEIIPLLKQAETKSEEAYAILGEPQLTQAQNAITSLSIKFDLQAEWKALTGFEGYPQASLVVKKSFADENRELVQAVLNLFKDNAQYIDNNLSSINNVLSENNSTIAALTFTKTTLKRCNLSHQSANDVKESVKDYILRLSQITLDDEFFYQV